MLTNDPGGPLTNDEAGIILTAGTQPYRLPNGYPVLPTIGSSQSSQPLSWDTHAVLVTKELILRYAAWLLAPLAGGLVLVIWLSVTGVGTVRILVGGALGAVAMAGVIWKSGVGGWNARSTTGADQVP
jgi:hypothetical protein